MRLIMQSFKNYKPQCRLLLLFTMIQAASQMFITGYVSNSVNLIMGSVSGGYDFAFIKSQLIKTSLILFSCAAVMAISSIVAGYFSSKISSDVGKDLRESLYKKVMSLSSKQINQISISSLITRTTSDTLKIQSTLFMVLSMSLMAPLMAVFGIIGTCRHRSEMEWIIFASIIAVIISMACVFKVVHPYISMLNYKIDEVNKVSREGLTGLQVIRAFGKEEWFENRSRKANEEYREYATNSGKYYQILMPCFSFIPNLASVLIVWFGAKKVLAGVIEVGVVVEFISYVQLIVLGFMIVASIGLQIPGTVATAKRLEAIMNIQPIIGDGNISVKDIPNHDEIRFENVFFRYSDDADYVLRDISFTAKKGELLAVVGNTGSGKTTIMRLITRLYDADKGKITVWGKDIKELKLDDFLETVGYVPQINYLFSGTVESNIRTGKKNATLEEVEEAARFAQAEGFIEKREGQFEGTVTQGGGNLSGGQRQRMAIARAVVRNPEIYILDDCFSALDNMTVKNLKAELEKKVPDSIMIIVSQRISAIMNADRILVLEGGKTAGIGTHSELMETCAAYREIVASQMSDEK